MSSFEQLLQSIVLLLIGLTILALSLSNSSLQTQVNDLTIKVEKLLEKKGE